MDERDRRLRRRLAALAEAVPLSAEPIPLARLSKPATRSRVSGFSTLAAAGVIFVVGLAIAVGSRGGAPAAGSPVPALTSSPVASDTGAATASPSPAVALTSRPSAEATRPPADVVLAYPDGCPAYGLSPRRCAYIVDWALTQAGLTAELAAVQLLGDPACEGQPAGCSVARTMTFVVRVRVSLSGGESTDHPVFCGLGGDASMLCTDTPVIRVTSPMSGYNDVPCGPVPGGEPGSHCATPMPTIAPSAETGAIQLRVATVAIPIDHAGGYVVDLGEATLPNGILSEAIATLADDTRSDVLIPDGIHLEVLGEDGAPLVNVYDHGWRAGLERVHVRLVFSVESFEPGTTLTITDMVVR